MKRKEKEFYRRKKKEKKKGNQIKKDEGDKLRKYGMQQEKRGRTETLRKESKNHLWAQGGLQCCISIQM